MSSLGKERRHLLTGERPDLRLGLVAVAVVAAETKGGVCGKAPILDGLGEHAADGTADVLDALAAQPLRPAVSDERPAVAAGEASEVMRTQHGVDVALEVRPVDPRRAELAHLLGVSLQPLLGVLL